MILSTLTRLVRRANPYVATLLDDKDFTKPGDYAKEADHKMESFKMMNMLSPVAVRFVGDDDAEGSSDVEAVAWAQRQPPPTSRPTGPRENYSRYPPSGYRGRGPQPWKKNLRCFACQEEGHFARECPLMAEVKEEIRRRRNQQMGGQADGKPPLNN